MAIARGHFVLASLAVCALAANTLTAVPSRSATPTSTYSYSVTAQALALSAISYSYPYTVTTPTTYWRAPTFATPMPLPRCSESVCPALNGQECQDVAGNKYGILCNTLLSGIVITNSGRKFLRQKERRSYTATFEGCLAFCDAYSISYCQGVQYHNGFCMAYDPITGTFEDPTGGFVAIRQT